MSKKYVIRNKVLRIVQSYLDEIRLKPENRNDAYQKFDELISKHDISDEHLKEVIEKMISEFKDFSYEEEIFEELKKMRGVF